MKNKIKVATGLSGLLFGVALAAMSAVMAMADPTRDANPRLTQAQAIQICRTFCQTIGVPVTGDATAQFPAPKLLPDEPASHWQTRWRIVFPQQAELELVDASGVISWYSNEALSRQLGYLPAGTAISRDQALRLAQAVVDASGQSGELGSLPTALLEQLTEPPTATGHYWYVRWPRQVNGIPYRSESVNVLIQAESGTVEGLSLTFPSRPPASTAVSLSSDQAVAAAVQQLAGMGIGNAVLESVQTQVVRTSSGDGRTVWSCRFAAGDRKPEVWIDAVTGEVVGSEQGGAKNRRTSSDAAGPLRHLLRSARQIDIYGRGARGRWRSAPSAVLSRRSHPDLFQQVIGIDRFTSGSGGRGQAYFEFVLHEPGEGLAVLLYAGQLGASGEWGIVPDRFRQWLNALARKDASLAAR